ncbi:gliding motility-associated-like protein [Lewinella marina]|nr:PKD domain-containing protein [Neolewinella marina]NJB85176.1 gliding motility-associated-like protein [Neolewinella marina]
MTLWFVCMGVTTLSGQSTCGEQDPFWLPPSRTFCVDSNGIATISFKLLNLGAPGNYTVYFPDGATAKYSGIEDTVTVRHKLEFFCSDPPGSPSLPTMESPFYAYMGELSIVRSDCVNSQGDSPRGSYDFNVIPNPLEEITSSRLTCLEAPFMVDLEAVLCQEDLVERFQWFLDGQPIGNSDNAQISNLVILEPGLHIVRVEATTNKEGCGPFFLEKEIFITEAPDLEVDFLVDSATLCLPEVTIATVTSAANVTRFSWSSDSPDVTFSDPTEAAPVIFIDNQFGDQRTITLTAGSETCGEVTKSFTLTTYNDQKMRLRGQLETCANESYRICEDLLNTLVVESIRWEDADVTTRITNNTTVCPEITFTTPGEHILTAVGIDVCGRPFSLPVTVWVRDNEPLSFEWSAIDTLCEEEPPVDLANHIKPWSNVASVKGDGVDGRWFNPAGLRGDVRLTVTDSCGAISNLSIHVLTTGGFSGREPVICQGEDLDLTSLQPGRYTGPGITDNVFHSAGMEPGLYQIEYISDAYCGGAGTITLTLHAPPVADFSIASPSCPGGDPGTVFPAGQPVKLVNLSGSEVICYSVLETGDRQCGSANASFTFPSAGTYTLQQVVGSRGTDCTDTLSRTIEVRNSFSPDFTYDLEEVGCDSLAITFHSKGLPAGVVPGWSLSNGKVLQAKQATIKMARPYEEKWMSVAVRATNGCFQFQDTFSLELPRRFQVSFGIMNDNRTVCSGDTVYLQDNSVNASQIRVTYPDGSTETELPEFLVVNNPTKSVLAYPIVLSGSSTGCNTKTVSDTIFILPVETRAGFNLTYTDNCAQGEVALVNLSTSGSNGRVFWGDGSSPQWVAVGDTIHHRYEMGRDTTVTISLEAALCGTDVYRKEFTVLATPNPTFSLVDSPAKCVGDSLRFLPEAATSGYSYDWDFGDGYFSQHQRPGHVYEKPGTYPVILEVTSASGCSAADTAWVTVGKYNGPTIDASIPEAACVDGPFPVQVHSPAAPALRFLYGSNRRSIGALERPFSQVGTFPFTLVAVDAAGCRTDTTVMVTVHPSLAVNIAPDRRDTTVELGNSLNLTFAATPQRALDSVLWSGNGVGDPTATRTLVTPIADELYRLSVTDQFGCRAFDSIMVRVQTDYRERVYSPNVFSPNGDGVNETFALQVKPNTVRSITSMRIRSRWGAVVYECRECGPGNGAVGWDGSFNGGPAKTGVYLWNATVEFVDGARQTFTGDVILLR